MQRTDGTGPVVGGGVGPVFCPAVGGPGAPIVFRKPTI